MGTISDKTTYLNTTKTKIREKINDLGQDLDEEDTFRSYAEALEQVWNEYPKVAATDVEEATLNETKKGRINIDLKGNTEQTQLEGKNKVNAPDRNVSSTGRDQYILNNVDIDSSKNYVISFDYKFNNTSFSSSGGVITLKKDNTYTSLVSSTSSTSGKITANISGTSKISLYVTTRLSSGSIDLSNIMLEEGSTATSYEPYCRTEYQHQIQTFLKILKM